MNENIISTKEALILLGLLVLFFLRELFLDFKNSKKKNSESIQDLSYEIRSLRESYIRVEGQIELLSKQLAPLVRLQEDFKVLFARTRERPDVLNPNKGEG